MALNMNDKNKKDSQKARLLIATIKDNIKLLINIISVQNPDYVGFEIEEILRVNEAKSINGGIESLNVTTLTEWHHCNRALNAWGKFHKDYSISPIFNFRLPGFVVIQSDHEKVAQLVNNINADKEELQQLVIKGRKHSVTRSEFIHHIDKSLITEQFYRKIPLMREDIKKVWFNWVSRPTPKIFSIEEFKEHIERKAKREPPFGYSNAQWNLKMVHLQKECDSGKYKSIHRFKRRQACPVIELEMVNNKGELERYQRTAAVPYIFNGQTNGTPTFTLLGCYSKEDMVKHETTKLSANKVWIDEDLKLIGVLKKAGASKNG